MDSRAQVNSNKASTILQKTYQQLKQSINIQQREQKDEEIYDAIIIGGGIAGLMAADILLKQENKVIILEASDKMGGTIRSYNIGETLEYIGKHAEWIQYKQQVKTSKIQIGASDILNSHSYIKNLVEEYDLTLIPMYSDGKFVYFDNQSTVKKVDSLLDLYFSPQFKKTVTKLLTKINNISKNIMETHENTINNPSKKFYSKMFKQYVEKFDKMTCKQFLEKQIEDDRLRKMVINQFEIVESLSVDKLSILQVLMHGYGLENLRMYTENKSYFTQSLKIKQGTYALIDAMKAKILKRAKKIGIQNPIIFGQPVVQIKNEINSQVQVLTSKNSYKCYKVFYSAALGRTNKIKISKISPAKKMIFDNQLSEPVQKIFLIFQSAFWRAKFSGSGIFSDKFPISEIIDVSPSNLCCGILCLTLCGKKPFLWQQKFQKYPTKQQKNIEMEKYIKKIVADAFLNGNIQDQNLQKMIIIPANLKHNFGYQTYTKMGICWELQSSGEDYLECYSRDQHNVIFLGGQLSKKYSDSMQGAIRYTREKIFKYLQMKDPWEINS